MKQYEFRLLDAAGKVTATTERTCATVQDAISISTTFSVDYRFVEILADGQVIARMPKG